MKMATGSGTSAKRATSGDLRVTIHRVDNKGPITGEQSKSFRLYESTVHEAADKLQEALAAYLEAEVAESADTDE